MHTKTNNLMLEKAQSMIKANVGSYFTLCSDEKEYCGRINYNSETYNSAFAKLFKTLQEVLLTYPLEIKFVTGDDHVERIKENNLIMLEAFEDILNSKT